MEVRTLGRLGRAFGDAGGSVPPSSQSVVRMLSGQPGGIPAVIGSTLLRALLFLPTTAGVAYFAGARRGKLAALTVTGSLGSSLAITMFLVAWHKAMGTAAAPAGMPSVSTSQGNAPIVPSSLPSTDSSTIAQQVMAATTNAVDSATMTQQVTDAPTAGIRGLRRGGGIGPSRHFGSSF